MTDKNTYWIADVDGTKALVEGTEARDYWTKVHGWTETTAPEGYEFVWLHNPDLGAPTRMNWTAAQDTAWTDLGFRPGPPAEPVNLAIPPEHPSRAVPVPAPQSPRAAKSASGGEKKE